MSILVVQVLQEGIIFGADRNVTKTSVRTSRNGRTISTTYGQCQRPKVLRWPNNKALIGYAGAATIGKMSSDNWLYDFIGRNLSFNRFDELSRTLRNEVQSQRAIDEEDEEPEGLIIHLAGFEEREQRKVPVVWYITNCHGLDPIKGYASITKEFGPSEELWQAKYIEKSTPDTIREYLGQRAKEYEPFWFHQGFDLGVFNTLDWFLRQSFRVLIEHKTREFPTTLTEWGKHLSMSILTYGAYFQSFYGPGEQYVGGGVDIVSLPWPS